MAGSGVTELLNDWSKGDKRALDRLVPLVYDELRRIARRHLSREEPSHTLQSTALVHEAYMRLVDQNRVQWQNRAHFFGVAGQLIRRILVDHARRRHASKRGGAQPSLLLDESVAAASDNNVDLLALDDALNDLSALDVQQARVVELRFFAGLTIAESAEALGISPTTVQRDWTVARAWLYRYLHSSNNTSASSADAVS
jgi:RNA polymerase sigma factor (TIGR02999 family)